MKNPENLYDAHIILGTSAASNKLQHSRSPNMLTSNFYFNRLPKIWNALPIIDQEKVN